MNKKLKELLYETLVAQAIGDAFGYIVEFKDWKTIKKEFGTSGYVFSNINNKNKLLVTDDTQMNLFCLEGMANAFDVKDLNISTLDPTREMHKEFLGWLATQGFAKESSSALLNYKELYFRRAPGNTCLSALSSNSCGTVNQKINNSKGCGGIMRTMPTAFFAIDMEMAFDWGVKQAAITHGHPSGFLSAGAYSALAYQLIYNPEKSISECVENILPILKKYEDSNEMIETINKTITSIKNNTTLKHDDLTKALGEGWVGEESFALAVYVAAKYEKFEDVVFYGSNHDGDSDSVAMLAAGIWHLKNRKSAEFMYLAPKIDVIKCIQETIEDVVEADYVAQKKSMKI